VTADRDEAREPLDLAAVGRDDAALDRLARRAPLSDEEATDPVLCALAALVADVDAPSTVALPGKEWTGRWDQDSALAADDAAAAAVVDLAPRERRRLAPTLVGSAVVAGLVLVSGGAAAAAVTGSPLAPVRAAIHAFHAVLGDPPDGSADPSGSANQSPGPAADASDTARVNAGLAGVGAALATGDLAAAQHQLADVLALVAVLPDLPPGLQHRLEHLQARVDRLSDPTGAGSGGPAGRPAPPGQHGQPGQPDQQGQPGQQGHQGQPGQPDPSSGPPQGSGGPGQPPGRGPRDDPGQRAGGQDTAPTGSRAAAPTPAPRPTGQGGDPTG
jgi:hypothetical protein